MYLRMHTAQQKRHRPWLLDHLPGCWIRGHYPDQVKQDPLACGLAY